MKTYVGTEIIQAIPMNWKDYIDFRGWKVPKDKDEKAEGYLVIFPDSQSNTAQYEGYVSWFPKDQFETAYLDLGKISHMPAFQQRLVGEWAQLKADVEKLSNFFKTSGFFKLDFQYRSKLEEQLRAMAWYKRVLDWRIKEIKS